jgi:hypothetical protein
MGHPEGEQQEAPLPLNIVPTSLYLQLPPKVEDY